MEKEPIYTNSILTFAFTTDGKLIVKKDKDGKLDTLPLLFMGYREQSAKTDYEDSIRIINSRDDYSATIADFFSYYGKETNFAINEGWGNGNPDFPLDCGELADSIKDNQIKEMANMDIPTYIRVNRDYYDYGETSWGKQIVNEIETRYIVLPNNIDISKYNNLETKELDEIIKSIDISTTSGKIIIGTTGKDGDKMKSFVNTLKSFYKNNGGSHKR